MAEFKTYRGKNGKSVQSCLTRTKAKEWTNRKTGATGTEEIAFLDMGQGRLLVVKVAPANDGGYWVKATKVKVNVSQNRGSDGW